MPVVTWGQFPRIRAKSAPRPTAPPALPGNDDDNDITMTAAPAATRRTRTPSVAKSRAKSKARSLPPGNDDNDEPVALPIGIQPTRFASPDKPAKSPSSKRQKKDNVPRAPAVPDPATAIVGRGRGRPRKNPVDSTGNKEIKGKNNARTKKIKDKEYIATTAPVMGYYDVTNDARMMKPNKIPANIINAI